MSLTNKLGKKLHDPVRQQYPTAVQVVLHHRLVMHPLTRLRQSATSFAAYDEQGRALVALSPEGLPELIEAIQARHGEGLLILDLTPREYPVSSLPELARSA